MYYEHYGLSQPPFRITPDTSLFYPGGNRGAVLEAVMYAIQNGEGIVKVVGEVGSGKTMLCRMLEQELPERVEIVYLANPRLPPENVLHAIAFELKLPVPNSAPRLQVMTMLQEHLLARHGENRQVVVFVEEAQGMPIATLEEIRLLSNLETRQHKLLQIVLFGQPELDQRIARPEIRQLKERITYSFQLSPFRTEDIREYLNARLRACGYRRGELFTPGAVRSIGRFSRGLVRRINILADKSLLAAYAENAPLVTVRHVRLAARDSEFADNLRGLWFAGGAIAAGLLLLLVAVWSWQARDDAGAEPAAAVTPPDSAAAPAESLPAGTVARPAPEELPASMPPPAVEATPVPVDDTVAVTDPDAPAQAGIAAVPVVNIDNESPAAAPDAQLIEADQGVPAAEGFELQALDGAEALSEAESMLLRAQLSALPPEEAAAGAAEACTRCWSIVYRPLVQVENL